MTGGDLTILGPLVFTSDLVFLFWSKVVLDVERLADLLRGLALDHVCNGLATNVEKWLDVQVVGSKNDLEEHFLVDLHELLVPLFNVGRLLAGVGVLIWWWNGVVLVMGTPLNNLLQNSVIDVGDWNRLLGEVATNILKHVLDQDGSLSDLLLDDLLDAVRAQKSDRSHFDCVMCVVICIG